MNVESFDVKVSRFCYINRRLGILRDHASEASSGSGSGEGTRRNLAINLAN